MSNATILPGRFRHPLRTRARVLALALALLGAASMLDAGIAHALDDGADYEIRWAAAGVEHHGLLRLHGWQGTLWVHTHLNRRGQSAPVHMAMKVLKMPWGWQIKSVDVPRDATGYPVSTYAADNFKVIDDGQTVRWWNVDDNEITQQVRVERIDGSQRSQLVLRAFFEPSN